MSKNKTLISSISCILPFIIIVLVIGALGLYGLNYLINLLTGSEVSYKDFLMFWR